MRLLKVLARQTWHTLLAWRQWTARRLLAAIDPDAGSPAPASLPSIWRLALIVYIVKRLIQDAFTGEIPWPPARFRTWRRRVETAFVFKLDLWATRGPGERFDPYAMDRQNNRLTPADARRMRALAADFEYRPLISIVVPVFNAQPGWIDRLTDSIIAQTYDRWELILVDDGSADPATGPALESAARRDDRITVDALPANRGVVEATNRAAQLAHGEYLAFVDHDDELTADALWWVVDRLQGEPDLDLIYTDEELVPSGGAPPYPSFKPDFSPELLTAYNYICHLLVVRRSAFDAVGKLRPGTDGAQDYDLVLRLVHRRSKVAHLPRVLYRWHLIERSMSRYVEPASGQLLPNPDLDGVTRRVVQDHFDRMGLDAEARVVDGWVLPAFRPIDRGKVSLVICTKDQPGLIARCVESIERLTDYPNYEIVIVDNASQRSRTRAVLSRLARRHRVVRIENGPEGFNYARLNNLAARLVDGTFLLFLNDDTQVLQPNWLSALVGYASCEGVGAVGARLLYDRQTIQHAGLIVGAMGWGPWHALIGVPANNPKAYAGYLDFPHNCIGVTGACMLTRRDRFLAMGGFDEARFAVGFNDVDYCLELHRSGLRCVFAPQAELFHFEGRSRGRTIDPAELARLRDKHVGTVDPYWNPHYTRQSPHFGIGLRRLPTHLTANRIPRVLVVARPTEESDPWPHWESLLEPLVLQGKCAFWVASEVASMGGRRRLRGEMTRGDVDVVFAQGAEMVLAIEQARALGIPSIWHLPEHLMLPPNPRPHHLRRLLRVRKAMPLPYAVVFNNVHSHAWAACGWPQGNFLVQDGVLFESETSSSIRDRTGCRRRILEERHLPDSTILLASVIRTDRPDEWRVLLDAYRRLDGTQRAKAFLLLVSETEPLPEELIALRLAILRSGSRTAFAVGTMGSSELIASADALIAFPTDDVRPLAVLRALELGVPVVGSRLLVESDLLYPGSTGLAVPEMHASALARALSKLIDDPGLRRSLGENAHHWLRGRAHPQQVLASWGSLFLEAAELAWAEEPRSAALQESARAELRLESPR